VKSVLYSFALVLVALPIVGQGTLLIDQTPANFSDPRGSTLMANTGQSFTPTFSSIGFIQLGVTDENLPGGSGSQLVVNLRQGSISGAIIGTTAPVGASGDTNGWGPTTFLFPLPIAVVPGTQYFFQPVDQIGSDTLNIAIGFYNYAGGTMYNLDAPSSSLDLWFTEGIVVPEPGTIVLLALGSGMVAWHVRRRRRTNSGSV
jgi:hypothetical protein